jgi:xylose dehydrogenase (NAD/NADP)
MADAAGRTRWGVLGTANIAANAFLPAMREAGGRAVVVGSRTPERGAAWAAANQVERAAGYQEVLDDPEVDAVYIALPNDQHTAWAARAVTAGKLVLCEKPMALDAAQAGELLAGVAHDALLWESFVFPFHPQTAQIAGLIADGRLGTVTEIVSEFHFQVGQAGNIRLQAERGGGAIYDVGCYPVRLARLLFGSEPVAAAGSSNLDGGVDVDSAAVVDFPADRRLLLSVGLHRAASTFSRIIGTDSELRLGNPFHPRASDTVELWTAGERVQTWPTAAGSAFKHAIDHLQQVLAGTAAPIHQATIDALPQAVALDLVRAAAIP